MESIEVRKEEKKNEKGYRLIVENLDTGEREFDIETRAIIGAAQGTDENGTHGIVVTSCSTKMLIETILGAENTIKCAKKALIEKNPMLALLLLSDLAGGGRQLRGTTYERKARFIAENQSAC